MEKRYRLLALDMDGTLLNEKSEISAENETMIREAMASGVTVCFATGRGQSALPYAEQLGLTSPMVLVNGSEVWKSPGELLSRTEMPVKVVRALRELAMNYDTWYWAYSTDGVYNRDHWPERDAETTWLKFGFYTEDDSARSSVSSLISSIGDFEVTNSHPWNIELNPKGINKASGLRQVCELLGIHMSEVIGMGDSVNDIAMIREVGLGVAMGNAQDVVKEAADIVARSNEENGVADVIRKFLLHK